MESKLINNESDRNDIAILWFNCFNWIELNNC